RPGYVLRVDLEQVDLFRFHSLLDEARSALADGDALRAKALVDKALNEWSGEPLDGIDAPGLDPGITAELLDDRTAAHLLKAEAELASGAHRESVPGLERLMNEEPLDERIHSLGAVALYRSGRQADALEVLSHLRRSLSEELGIEPGPAVV